MDPSLLTRIVLFVTMAGAGAGLLWVARAAASGRLARNSTAGIRTPSTMASDEAWLAAHQRAERLSVWTGIIALVCSGFVWLPLPVEYVTLGVLAGCLVILVLALYGARVGSRAARAVAELDDDTPRG